MAKTDLSDYNLGELKGLQFEVDKELRKRRLDDVNAARAQIAALAQGTGLSVEALLRNQAGKTRGR